MKLAILGLCTACLAQAGALRVIVRDPSGAFVPGASVHAGSAAVHTAANGEAVFDDLPQGRLELKIEAQGFTSYTTTLNIKTGRITIERTLRIAPRQDQVDVGVDPREDKTDPKGGGSLVTLLTEKEIEQLPDDPDLFEQALKDMAGPGAVIRIDGFRGGRLPPKNQIQSPHPPHPLHRRGTRRRLRHHRRHH